MYKIPTPISRDCFLDLISESTSFILYNIPALKNMKKDIKMLYGSRYWFKGWWNYNVSGSDLYDNVKIFSAIKITYVNTLKCLSMLCIKHGSFLNALRISTATAWVRDPLSKLSRTRNWKPMVRERKK